MAVVGICGPEHLERCLAALDGQRGAPPFDVVVAYDPELRGMEEAAARHPEVRMVANRGQRTPLELASRAVETSRGEVVLLTEDHCVPDPRWVDRLTAALDAPGAGAAVGGAVAVARDATPTDVAFYFVDFVRYAPPLRGGPSPTLTVCNVAYRRAALEAIRPQWSAFFHETAVNDALRRRFGPLRLTPDAPVTMRRHVRFRDAVRERYAFGRLFGCTRLAFASLPMRVAYTLGAPLLPLVLLGRMARRALPAAELRRPFLRALGPLAAMVLAWSWGEWLGYLTRRRPADLTVAQEQAGPPAAGRATGGEPAS
ncbi:MAG: glycosyltransferase [Myxococcota bacterium]|nr:glycosyltransferase [Myxococcota bacterium]